MTSEILCLCDSHVLAQQTIADHRRSFEVREVVEVTQLPTATATAVTTATAMTAAVPALEAEAVEISFRGAMPKCQECQVAVVVQLPRCYAATLPLHDLGQDSMKQCQVVIREKPEVREREKVVEAHLKRLVRIVPLASSCSLLQPVAAVGTEVGVTCKREKYCR